MNQAVISKSKDIAYFRKVTYTITTLHSLFKDKLCIIIDTIFGLFNSENYIIGLLILLFSIIIPIVKNIIMFTASLKHHPGSQFGIKIINNIGKWSMADVMIVALFLAFFAIDGDQMTRAKLQAGIYFFTGYVILSMISSHFIAHEKDQKIDLQ